MQGVKLVTEEGSQGGQKREHWDRRVGNEHLGLELEAGRRKRDGQETPSGTLVQGERETERGELDCHRRRQGR